MICDTLDVNNVRNNMIGEIENPSSHLFAIKEDVETQGEFVNSLIREVNNAVYPDIEDVVAFVKWLDDELCFLVDERAVDERAHGCLIFHLIRLVHYGATSSRKHADSLQTQAV
ncbi:Actin-binding FH2 [Artemisia annua]|uniref:Actin-binding FH2 n=1 Tax=Artemisia annua TaxID=35608 RepID=A0A2U1KB49_ARTAN|nr:Actin-binding FH2 [Artemisia annua]